MLAQLKVAKEKEQTKKQRLSTGPPEVNLYRTITPPKNKKQKGGD